MVGSNESYTYDSASGRMTQWQSNSATGNQTGTLTWNANGTLQALGITDNFNAANAQNCAYGYDALARLASGNCGTTKMNQNFSYDVWGNITKTVPTGSTGVAYNPVYDSHNHASTSTYDSAGNTLNDGSNSYTYDSEGRPVMVGSTQIVYDVFNRAVEMNNGSSHKQIVYDASGAKLAYMSGQTLQKYMLPLAGGVQAVFNSSGLSYYRHADWLGSSRLALNTSGNMVSAGSYAPFGETYLETGTADRSYTGQTQDVIAGATGVYDFLFRQQASSQGRWLVPDPAGLAAVDITNPQTWNRYAYVGNNPMNNVDPLGLWCGPGSVADEHSETGCSPAIRLLPLDFGCDICGAYAGFTITVNVGAGGGGGGGGQPQPGPDPVVSNQKPFVPPCQTQDPFINALEWTIKIGPEVQAGPLKVGASWYGNVTTGDVGAKLEGSLGLVGGSIDAPKGPLGFGGGPQNNKASFTVLGFNYESSTGRWKFNPTKSLKSLTFGAQLIVGFEASFNSETFSQIANQNANCIAKRIGG